MQRAPQSIVPVLIELERADVETRLVVGELVVRALQPGVRQVVRDSDVRVVRKVQRPLERTTAHAPLEPLAVADATGDGNENHWRNRTKRTGATQMHSERRLLCGHCAQMFLGLVED